MDSHPELIQAWPPPYTLKKHPRAKRIRFRASFQRGLEVIVPSYFNLKNIPALLEENRLWIETQLLNLQMQGLPWTDVLPSEVFFQALNASWKVFYQAADKRLRLVTRPQQELVLLGNLEDKPACKRKLLAWVKELAKEHLLPLLERLSLEMGVNYSKAGIRDQSSRWGSCSKNGSIYLNYKLIFFPSALVRHTLLHELCHRVHFNHSEQFWALLARYDDNWRENRRALKKAERWIPEWVLRYRP